MIPQVRSVLIASFLSCIVLLCACSKIEPLAQEPPYRDLGDEAFRSWDAMQSATSFDDTDAWMSVEVAQSTVTGTKRRLWFEKEAATRALENHERPRNGVGEKMPWPKGSVFIAETIDRDGDVSERAIIAIDDGGAGRYAVFGADGSPANELGRGPGHPAARLSSSCRACHAGDKTFHPMMSYPSEPVDVRLELPEGRRDVRLALVLNEGRRRGSRIIGVYGTLWLSHLAWSARNGTLLERDAAWLERLRPAWGDLVETP